MFTALTKGIEGTPAFNRHTIRTGSASKQRVIHKPNQAMRVVHERLLDVINPALWQLPELPVIKGSIEGESIRTNVESHAGNRYIYATDLHDAFGSVDHHYLAGILAEAVCGKDLAYWLEADAHDFIRGYCSETDRGLVLGGPAIPALFNLYTAVILDRRLIEICAKAGIVYTRYVDDLTFSSAKPIGHKRRRQLREAIEAAGFVVVHHKSHYVDLAAQRSIVITGLRLELGGRITPTRASMEQARAMMLGALNGEVSIGKAAGHMSIFFTALRDTKRPLNQREKRQLRLFRKLLRTQ